MAVCIIWGYFQNRINSFRKNHARIRFLSCRFQNETNLIYNAIDCWTLFKSISSRESNGKGYVYCKIFHLKMFPFDLDFRYIEPTHYFYLKPKLYSICLDCFISLYIYIYTNESLFPLVTASRVNGWTDFANSFIVVIVIVRRRFFCVRKN